MSAIHVPIPKRELRDLLYHQVPLVIYYPTITINCLLRCVLLVEYNCKGQLSNDTNRVIPNKISRKHEVTENTDKPVKQQTAYRLTLTQPKNINYNEAELFHAKTHAITSAIHSKLRIIKLLYNFRLFSLSKLQCEQTLALVWKPTTSSTPTPINPALIVSTQCLGNTYSELPSIQNYLDLPYTRPTFRKYRSTI